MIGSLDRATTLRLGRTLSAQAYGQVVTIVVQLALVPLLLHAWGADVYGAWLVLAAIPFFLTFSDLGFTFVAKNEMVMAVAASRPDGALRTFQSILALLGIALPLLFVVAALIIVVVDVRAVLRIDALGAGAVSGVLLLLAANVLLYQLFLLICGGIRAENRPASEAGWAATARLGEGAAIALAALGGRGVIAAAGAALLSRLLFIVLASHWLHVRSAWLRFGFAQASVAELRRIAPLAFAYMAMPLGQALLIQGPVIIVGGTLGAAAVVVLSTSRTLARLGTSAGNMLNNSVVSEFSALAGAGDWTGFARLIRTQVGATLILGAVYIVALLVLAAQGLRLLTHGNVVVEQPFFFILLLGVAAELFWCALFTPISAINRHGRVTLGFLIIALITLAVGPVLSRAYGLTGIAVSVLAAQLVMIPLCLLVLKQTNHGQ